MKRYTVNLNESRFEPLILEEKEDTKLFELKKKRVSKSLPKKFNS